MATRDDLGEFLDAVLNDFERGGGREEWENPTLDRFLEGLTAFTRARVRGASEQEDASWRLFAQIVVAATGYEWVRADLPPSALVPMAGAV